MNEYQQQEQFYSEPISRLHGDAHLDISGVGQEDAERKEVLTITIDLGNGNSENIVVLEGDDPHDLAVQFVLRHQLNMKLKDLLAA